MPERKTAIYLTIHHTGGPIKANKPFAKKLLDFQALMQGGYDIQYPKYLAHVTFGDIPYHYFISVRGEIAEARQLKYSARSNTIYKTDIREHITVVLEGNFEVDQPTDAQLKALVEILTSLAKQHKIPLQNIGYHRTATEKFTICPGKNLISKMDMIKEELTKAGIK